MIGYEQQGKYEEEQYARKGDAIYMGDNILDIITDHSVNEGMNNILFGNEECMGIQKEIDGQTEQLENLGLTTEQHLAVDRLISSYTASGACYGRLTYRKGFQDCISLLQEMRLIGAVK